MRFISVIEEKWKGLGTSAGARSAGLCVIPLLLLLLLLLAQFRRDQSSLEWESSKVDVLVASGNRFARDSKANLDRHLNDYWRPGFYSTFLAGYRLCRATKVMKKRFAAGCAGVSSIGSEGSKASLWRYDRDRNPRTFPE